MSEQIETYDTSSTQILDTKLGDWLSKINRASWLTLGNDQKLIGITLQTGKAERYREDSKTYTIKTISIKKCRITSKK